MQDSRASNSDTLMQPARRAAAGPVICLGIWSTFCALRVFKATAATAAALVLHCLNVGHEKTGALLLCMRAAPSHEHDRLKPLSWLVAIAIARRLYVSRTS